MINVFHQHLSNDQSLFSNLIGEISCLQEVLAVLETETVSEDEAIGMVSGIQRDIIQLYRSAQE